MSEFPDTRDSLLVQVKDSQNGEAWERFARLYQPVIYRLARQRGLQDADAHDLTQQVLVAVVAAIPRWEANGKVTRFRNWLSRVTRNAIINSLSRQPHDRAVGGSSVQQLLCEQPQSDEGLETQIECEFRRELYLQAADIVRIEVQLETWQAFELTVIDGRDISEVARQFDKPVGAIYTARSRVMRRLREAVRKLEDNEQ